MTNTPPLAAPATQPELEPAADVATGTPLLTPGEEPRADERSRRGIRVIDQPQGDAPSRLVEIRTEELPRGKPRMDFDQPRDSRDDDPESEERRIRREEFMSSIALAKHCPRNRSRSVSTSFRNGNSASRSTSQGR